MSDTNTNNTTTAKSKRVKYGFELTFPDTFTLRDLRKQKSHKVKYITLYARVRKAIDEGLIVESGLKEPTAARRGRKEVVYKVVNNEAPVSTAEVAVPAAMNW
jgi:hypothetical protein